MPGDIDTANGRQGNRAAVADLVGPGKVEALKDYIGWRHAAAGGRISGQGGSFEDPQLDPVAND